MKLIIDEVHVKTYPNRFNVLSEEDIVSCLRKYGKSNKRLTREERVNLEIKLIKHRLSLTLEGRNVLAIIEDLPYSGLEIRKKRDGSITNCIIFGEIRVKCDAFIFKYFEEKEIAFVNPVIGGPVNQSEMFAG